MEFRTHAILASTVAYVVITTAAVSAKAQQEFQGFKSNLGGIMTDATLDTLTQGIRIGGAQFYSEDKSTLTRSQRVCSQQVIKAFQGQEELVSKLRVSAINLVSRHTDEFVPELKITTMKITEEFNPEKGAWSLQSAREDRNHGMRETALQQKPTVSYQRAVGSESPDRRFVTYWYTKEYDSKVKRSPWFKYVLNYSVYLSNGKEDYRSKQIVYDSTTSNDRVIWNDILSPVNEVLKREAGKLPVPAGGRLAVDGQVLTNKEQTIDEDRAMLGGYLKFDRYGYRQNEKNRINLSDILIQNGQIQGTIVLSSARNSQIIPATRTFYGLGLVVNHAGNDAGRCLPANPLSHYAAGLQKIFNEEQDLISIIKSKKFDRR